jgi:glycosyltransferase involved in cell wall biosynthesis
MDERKQINLIYQYNDKWIGGTYYMLNIIKALDHLPNDKKPKLVIYHDQQTPLAELQQIAYPYMEYVNFKNKLKFLFAVINKLAGRALFTIKLPGNEIKNFYYRSFELNNSNLKNYYCWIADMQDMYLPQFFKPSEIKKRLSIYKRMVKEQEPIVFSSNAALNDFNKFFPGNTNNKKVVSFVSLPNADLNSLSINELKKKYNITNNYFIVSNQFWKHKNHEIVLKAFHKLFKTYPNLQLILTGKEYDYRDPDYTSDLKQYVKQNELDDKILFLGFIPRLDQLKLMGESIAIIQPSLFEGWSTVVEDAKLLRNCIICSDIPVHREQLPNSTFFFNPRDEQELIKVVKRVLDNGPSFDALYDHQRSIVKFAEEFIGIFD